MKPAIPWSVKGVEHETREAAKAAARRAGMTLGAWLNHVIQQSGDQAEIARAQIALAETPDDGGEDPAELSTVLTRLNALETHQNTAIQHLEHALEMLASRVPPQGQAHATTSLEPRLAQLEADSRRRFDRLAKELGTIATRYSDLEERQQNGRAEIAELLDEMTKRPAPAPAGKAGDARFVETLERRLQAMDNQLDAVGRDARNAATTFQQALSAVMGRVVEGEKRQRQQESQIGARFEVFESKIDGLADRLEDVLQRDGASETDAVQRLEQMVGAVTRQFEVVESRRERSHIAMEKTLRALAERLAETDRRHTEQVEEPLAALHQAVEDMSKRIAATSSTLEERLSDVTERIEHGDTEFRASRFSLMHGMDDVRRRLEAIEAGQAPLPPLVDTPQPPRRPLGAGRDRFEPGFTEKAQPERDLYSALAQARAVPEPEPEPEPEPALETAEVEIEPDAVVQAFTVHEEPLALDDVIEAMPPDEEIEPTAPEPPVNDPVSSLLAAAREAARARAADGHPGAEWHDDEAVDATFSVDGGPSEPPPADAAADTLSRKLDKGRAPKIMIAVVVALGVVAAGVAALKLSTPRKASGGDRPGLLENLLPERSSFMFEREVPADAAPAGAAEAVPAEPLPAVPEESAAMFTPPPEPASSAELASLATSAIADLRAATTPDQLAKAAEKVTQAAMLGDAEAQFTLGRLSETGEGVKADREASRRWYEEAAAQGHAGAAFNLGMLEARKGGQDGYQHAADWFARAAAKGYADAQYNLAMLYARGLGIAQDEAEAYAWFAAAASRGDAGAAAERDRLSQRFDAATRERAEALARNRIEG